MNGRMGTHEKRSLNNGEMQNLLHLPVICVMQQAMTTSATHDCAP
ncbi:hypothetical protein J2X61_003225 [Bacillus sp. 3255]|nr:hypothetical protein [Bacillus sp. 3255]